MKSKLNLITYASVLAKQDTEAIIETHQELISALAEHYDVNIIMHQNMREMPDEGLNLVFVATGGTEGMVVRDYNRLPHPIYLLTDGKANSLAASLELRSRLDSEGRNSKIIHGSVDAIVKRLLDADMSNVVPTFEGKSNLLKGTRIGVIGHASDWLVASSVDYHEAQRTWGAKYVDIPLDIVEQYYSEVSIEEAQPISLKFSNNAQSCIEPNNEDILKATRLYLAIKRVAMEYRLDALTLQCFSLIPTTCTTGCLALALLNDDGIVAGCEGDMQSIFTMLFVKRLTGCDSFMANPALIDTDKNEVTFAHCTIGLKQTTGYIIRSHFESMSGVAIQGFLPEKDVTIVKIGGAALDKMMVMEGRIVANENDSRKCRTQIRIAVSADYSVSDILNHSIGNHHIIVQGHHADKISKFKR